jgi:hypothetical protein
LTSLAFGSLRASPFGLRPGRRAFPSFLTSLAFGSLRASPFGLRLP